MSSDTTTHHAVDDSHPRRILSSSAVEYVGNAHYLSTTHYNTTKYRITLCCAFLNVVRRIALISPLPPSEYIVQHAVNMKDVSQVSGIVVRMEALTDGDHTRIAFNAPKNHDTRSVSLTVKNGVL